LRTPLEAFSPVTAVVVNAGIAMGAVLLLTFPANLFNETFSENYADISAWWHKWALAALPERLRRRLREWLAQAKNWALARLGLAGRSDVKKDARETLAFAVVVTAGSLLGALLDPAFGLNLRTLVSFVAIVLAMLAGVTVAGLVTGIYHRARRHGKVARKLHALPLGLVVAGACVVISRATGFEPGYLYGVVCGVTFGRELNRHEEGHVVALGSLAMLGVALLAWVAWAGLNPVASRPGSFFGAVLGDDFLASLFVSGLVGTVISLFPLRFMPGYKLRSWHKGAWAVTFGVALFLLVDALLRPGSAVSGSASTRSHVPLVTALALLVLFGGASLAFREHFARKHRRGETGSDDVAPPPSGEELAGAQSSEPAAAGLSAPPTDG
jgi:hypothetical protein